MLGIPGAGILKKNVSYSIGTKHYLTFQIAEFFNYSSSGTVNFTEYIDERSGIMIYSNLTQYVKAGTTS